MIDFTRAFSSAWERTMVILFRPFDLGKWCVIGFNAFLAGLLAGGNGFSFSYQNGGKFHWSRGLPLNPAESFNHQITSVLSGFTALQAGLVTGLVIFGVILGLAVLTLLYWLGARGQFLFLDNLVRNREAVAGPWKIYANPANRVFLFYLLLAAASLVFLLLVLLPAALIALPSWRYHHWPQGGALISLVMLGLLDFLAGIVFFCAAFLFREWAIPLIFRRGLSVRAALAALWNLVRQRPGSTTIFLLLRLALWLALVIVSLVACCFTCCLALLPYVGTVVILPALIYTRCFSLDCLAQLGPDCDVWTVDVPPSVASVPPETGTPTPPPPL